MGLLIVVQVILISSYGERHMVRPSYPTDGVTSFHVSSLSLVCTGSILCLDRLILRIVWQPSTRRPRHLMKVTVRSFVYAYVCTYLHTYVRHQHPKWSQCHYIAFLMQKLSYQRTPLTWWYRLNFLQNWPVVHFVLLHLVLSNSWWKCGTENPLMKSCRHLKMSQRYVWIHHCHLGYWWYVSTSVSGSPSRLSWFTE